MEVIKHSNFIWQYLNVADTDSILQTCLEVSHNDPKINPRKQSFFVKNSSYDITQLSQSHYSPKSKGKLLKVTSDLNKIYFDIWERYTNDNSLFSHTLIATCPEKIGTRFHFRNYETDEEYKWHVDLHGKFKFILSAIFYLNDSFMGGETEFLNDNISVKPIKNSILVFPCGPYFIHKSIPVNEGTKNIIWSCFDYE